MTRRRPTRRRPARRRRTTDLPPDPEIEDVRLPLDQTPERAEPGTPKKRAQDAVGEGNVTELAQDLDDESVRALEKNSARTQPRAAPHRHREK